MQCDLCDNKATVHLMEIHHGKKVQRHLCEGCARREGIMIKSQAPVNELLSNLVKAQQETEKIRELRCPQCQITWSEFRQRGLLGCPNDYLAFEKPLKSLITHAQGTQQLHVGKFPRHLRQDFGQQVQLLRLRQNLQQAVESEDYETAARLRDEISKAMPN